MKIGVYLGLGVGRAQPSSPALLTTIPYQKVILGNALSYDLSQHFVNADKFELAPGSPSLHSGLSVALDGTLSGTAAAAQMDVYPIIRATNTGTGLYVDTGATDLRISVAQDPGPAPAPTLSQVSSTVMRFTRGALPTNIPSVQCDLLEGPNTPLNATNGTSRLGVLTSTTTYDLTLPTGATRRAKMRYRVNWGDGTSFPNSYTASTESSALTLSPGTSAPSILVAGSISPSTGPVGTVYTLTAPVADGAPAPTVSLTSLMQNGVDVTASVVSGQFTSTASGPLDALWTATNGVGSDATSTASATITGTAGSNWYDTVFARRDGAGVGPRVGTFTPVASWLPQTGVSLSGTTVTVSGSSKTVTGIDFSGYRLINTGDNNIFEDCLGDINTTGQVGNNRQWDIRGANPTVRYCKVTNPTPLGGVYTISFNDATGNCLLDHCDFRDAAAQDVIAGPDVGGGSNILTIIDTLHKGIHLTTGAHVDICDMRGAGVGSKVSHLLSIGDKTASSAAAGGGTGYTNVFHDLPTDPHGSACNGLIFEECILVGHDDVGANSIFIQVGNSASTGIRMYDLIYDLREHNSLLHSSVRVDDWYARSFDYAASLTAGALTGLSGSVPFPNLANQPAAVPSTMSAPVITAAAGGFNYAAMARPANQRDLITGYAMEYSFDGTTWTAATETISLAGGSVATPSGANLRARVWAINGIGAATKSSASNLVTVASSLFSYTLVNEQGSGTIAAADMPELEISTNFGSSYQTLAAAGYTLSVVSGKLQIAGLAGGYAAGQVLVRYKDGSNEPFFGVDTPGATDATGALIKEIYARHATGPRPALGATTANNLPGLPIVGTRWNLPVTAT